MQILIATQNPAKEDTYAHVIRLAGFVPVRLADLGEVTLPEIPEDRNDLEQNAARKAVLVAQQTGHHAIATDEGFHVERYDEKDNSIIRYEPRRLGLGRRATDKEVIAWHNKRLRTIGGSSPARFTIAFAIASPDGTNAVQSFPYHTMLYERQGDFPPIRKGYPLDSQSRSVKSGRFISELSGEERREDMPMREMADFMLECIGKFIR